MSVKLYFYLKKREVIFIFFFIMMMHFFSIVILFIISTNKKLLFFVCPHSFCAFTCNSDNKTTISKSKIGLLVQLLLPVYVCSVFFLNRRATVHTHTLVFIRRMKSISAIMTLFIFSDRAKAVVAIQASIYIRCICIWFPIVADRMDVFLEKRRGGRT